MGGHENLLDGLLRQLCEMASIGLSPSKPRVLRVDHPGRRQPRGTMSRAHRGSVRDVTNIESGRPCRITRVVAIARLHGDLDLVPTGRSSPREPQQECWGPCCASASVSRSEAPRQPGMVESPRVLCMQPFAPSLSFTSTISVGYVRDRCSPGSDGARRRILPWLQVQRFRDRERDSGKSIAGAAP